MMYSSLARAAALAAALLLPPAHANDVREASELLQRGNAGLALERIDAFLASNPSDAAGRFLRAVILVHQDRREEAMAAFRRLTEEQPELPEPHNNLGVLYAAQGRYEDAKRALEMAVMTAPGYATAHENLGDVHVRLAAQSYERAMKYDPKNRSAVLKLKLVTQLLATPRDVSPAAVRSVP